LLNHKPMPLGEFDTNLLAYEEVVLVSYWHEKRVVILHFLLRIPLEKNIYKWYNNTWGSRCWKVESSWGLGKGYNCLVLDNEYIAQAKFLKGVWMIVGA
jgi:hypothetical protein